MGHSYTILLLLVNKVMIGVISESQNGNGASVLAGIRCNATHVPDNITGVSLPACFPVLMHQFT